jgi:hypothetical protein
LQPRQCQVSSQRMSSTRLPPHFGLLRYNWISWFLAAGWRRWVAPSAIMEPRC